MKTLAVCIVCKDDLDCLKENIEYHTLIGVEHFFIYDHNSAIPLKDALRQYKNVTVELVGNTGDTRISGHRLRCWEKNKDNFQWIGYIDTDEFIVMKNGNTDLKEFLKPYEKYGGLVIYWRNFGSSGYKKKQKSVIRSYTKCKSHYGPGYKTILNTQFGKPHQNPHICHYSRGKFAVDEGFNKVVSPPRNNKVKRANEIQINHYLIRSEEDYIEKVRRTGAVTPKRAKALAIGGRFYTKYLTDSNEDTDTFIIDFLNKI